MNVNEMYLLMREIISKNLQQGYFDPKQFNTFINQSQISFVAYLLGEFQQYQYQRPVARVEFGQNSIVRQRLTPIIYGYNLSVDSTGFSKYPSDFQQVDAMNSIYGWNRIKYVQQNYLSSYYNSKINPIATNPIYMIEELGFRFYPTTLGNAKLNYVRTPPTIVWAYTLDGNGRPVYDPINSVDCVFYETDQLDIISRALAMVGVSLDSNGISQFAQQIKMQGQ
jgi:hypothetical protein